MDVHLDDTVFKRCPSCARQWKTRESFLDDPALKLNGYAADFEELTYGLFFFTHETEGCYSTMTVAVNQFEPLYTGPRYSERKRLSPECPRYCADKNETDRCEVECECAYPREIMHVIRERQSFAGRASP
jgi:hypothetical protein